MAPPKSSPNTRKRASQPVQDSPPPSFPAPATQATPIAGIPTMAPPPEPSPLPAPATTERTAPIIASVPTVKPPGNNESHPLPYGRFNSKDAAFFIQAYALQLRTILAATRQHLRRAPPAAATKDDLLAEIFRLRQHEALNAQTSSPSPEQILAKLMTMSTQEVMQFAHDKPDDLKSMMHTAITHDKSLYPRNFPLDNNAALPTIVITWQYNAYKAANPMPSQHPPVPPASRQVRFQTTLPAPATVAPSTVQPTTTPNLASLASLLDPAPQPRSVHDDSSEDSDAADTRSHRHQTFIKPQGFTYGAGSAIPQLLRCYPGRDFSSRSLNVKQMRGPRILCNWIASGIDVPTFLFHFKWKRTAAGFPSQAEMEAHTLGRMIHLEMLAAPSPKHALETRPSLEVALRRLYAILYVEESLASGLYTDKGLAWSNVEFLLESHPNSTVLCDEISDDVIKRIAMEKKRLTAVRAMELSRSTHRRRNNKPDTANNSAPSPSNAPAKKGISRR